MAKVVEDIGTLKINLLSQAQYEAEIASGTIQLNELYLTPSSGTGVSDVEVDGTSVVSGGVASIDLTGKADVSDIPTKVSDLTNDTGYITGYTETDPTVPSWAKQSSKPSYTFSEIGSKPTTINGYGITDAKISSGTITLGNNSITPLTSYTETDPVFSASAAHGISSSDISNWNGKSDFSGNYNDLTNKPTIPTVNNATLTIQKNGTTVKTFTANASSNVTANISVPTKVSDLTNDSGYITGYTETDPVFSASAARGIASSDITSWNGKYAKPSTGIPKTDLASAVQTSLGKADTALQSFTETDPIFTASAAYGISSSDITNWNSKQDSVSSITTSEIDTIMSS